MLPMREISSHFPPATTVLLVVREALQIVSQGFGFGVSSETSMGAWPYNNGINLTARSGHAPCWLPSQRISNGHAQGACPSRPAGYAGR